ncbi:MAG: 30S ribosomal protein S8 [Candidatus Kapaibacterium sp.]|nr:MAG: 30S ribosomal protein S8 [Candidatus Kapabacteria bacterium]
MQLSDPISDFLTRIRNAQKARHKRVDIPSSKMKVSIAKILKEQGYIGEYEVISDNKQGILRVSLRYHNGRAPFDKITRVSRPGIRRYTASSEAPRVRSGLGIAILSTPKGIMSDKEARKLNVGGEVLCTIY